jgi:8-oxo-dGTP pyrophosphatase MutT (NUDIX family)
MIIRNCAGGIVFCGDKVLLLRNDKHEWVFPKGVVRVGQKEKDIALERIKIEAGIDARILAPCGKTHYEFYSITRQKPIHNNVSWFVMSSDSDKVTYNTEADFIDGRFFELEEAMEAVTYSQDKSLLMMAYQRYKELI